VSKLRFQPIFHSSEMQQLVLPVEVRKSNLALVATALTSDSVDVTPGTYHVTATMPTGKEFYNQVAVENEAVYTIELYPDAEDASPHESEEVQHYIVEQKAGWDSGALESLGVPDYWGLLRVFQGNLLQGQAVLQPFASAVERQTPLAQGTGRLWVFGEKASLVQLLQPNTPPLNVVLPMTPRGRCTLLLSLQAGGVLTADVQLENTMADTLLRYYSHGMIAQVGSLVGINSPALISENLLQGKFDDPIGAVVGAYVLLRLGQIERLHSWTEHLFNSFAWLPDAAAIRMEHLARVGQHTDAWEILQQISERGLPFFGDGLSLVVNRLREYAALSKDDRPEARAMSLPGEKVEALQKLIRPFAAFADLMKPAVTFTGLDPNRPNDEPLGESLDEFEGLDCTTLLG
jgi:hypothetical protein